MLRTSWMFTTIQDENPERPRKDGIPTNQKIK